MTPADLLAALLSIYPSFADDWNANTAISHGYWDDSPSRRRLLPGRFPEDSPTVSREAAVAVDVPLIEGEGLEQILAHLVR